MYRNYPVKREELPHHWVYTASASGPVTGDRRGREHGAVPRPRLRVIHSRVRAETFLGVWVVFMDMFKDFDYDGWRVFPRSVRVGRTSRRTGSPSTGWSLAPRRTPVADRRLPVRSAHVASDRQVLRADPGRRRGGANPHAWSYGKFNGDWATPNDAGLADCKDDD